MPFTIIAENCTGCSACEQRCPTRAISGDPKKAYLIEGSMCIDCGACGVICPDEAILDTFGNMTSVLKKPQRPVAIVHPDNCNGCGVCVDVCPFDSLDSAPGNDANFLGKVISKVAAASVARNARIAKAKEKRMRLRRSASLKVTNARGG